MSKRAKNPTSEKKHPGALIERDGASTSNGSSSRSSSLAESEMCWSVTAGLLCTRCGCSWRGSLTRRVTPRCWWLGCWCKTRRGALDGSPSARSRGRGEEAWPVPGSHSALACRWCARRRCASRQWFGCRMASRRGSRWGRNCAALRRAWPVSRWIWTAPAATWTVAWQPSHPGRWRCRRCRQSVAERWRRCQTHSSYSSSTRGRDDAKVKPFFRVVLLRLITTSSWNFTFIWLWLSERISERERADADFHLEYQSIPMSIWHR